MSNAAWRWKISLEHLSRLAANPDRPPYWDDAAKGLPVLTRAEAAAIRRRRLAAGVGHAGPNKGGTAETNRGSGYAFRGYVVPRSVLGVIQEIGGLAVVGEEGVVSEVVDHGQGECYLIAFERGEVWMDAIDLPNFLVETGKERQP